jgi:hypothetical protein
MGGTCGTHEERKGEVWWRNMKKRALGRSRRRWECNIKVDVKEIGLEVVDWIHLARDRTVMELPVIKSGGVY